MVVAPLEHRDPRSPPNPGNYVLEVEKVKSDTERRSPPAAPLTFLCSDNNITCSSSSNAASGQLVDHGHNITGDAAATNSGGQIWTRPGSSATSQSASIAIAAKPNITVVEAPPPSGGLKRRRDSSVSNSSSSSDEETGVALSKYHRKRRFFSHREYKGRKGGSPPVLERRVWCRRRSGSCSSSPDTRQGSDYYFKVFSRVADPHSFHPDPDPAF
jgi:hypothetical protein